jgi:hypothetical protein
LYILRGLCGGLEEEKTGIVCVFLGIGGGDGTLVGVVVDEIELIAGKGDDDVFVGLALEFFYPGFCFIE